MGVCLLCNMLPVVKCLREETFLLRQSFGVFGGLTWVHNLLWQKLHFPRQCLALKLILYKMYTDDIRVYY